MKKYTVYEIEKLTKGKISKYKLTQAIEKGELLAESVQVEKHGRGLPKYFVYENELDKYLDQVYRDNNKQIDIPGERDPEESSQNFQEIMSNLVTEQKDILIQKDELILSLKEQTSQYETEVGRLKGIVEFQENTIKEIQNKDKKCRSLLIELSNLSMFQTGKRKELIQLLNDNIF